MEETFSVGNQRQLHAKLWLPDDEPVRELVLIIPGLGDHSGRYDQVAQRLNQHGLGAFAIDLPGHGRTGGLRGHIRNYDALLSDLHATRDQLYERLPAARHHLLGHSMGGNIAMNYVLRHGGLRSEAGDLGRMILVAPMLLPPNPPPRPRIFAAWMTGFLLPWIRVQRRLDEEGNAQDARQVAAMRSDPLMHTQISIYLATQLLAQGRWALDHARNIRLPTLIVDGENDESIDRAASRNVAIRIGEHATHITIPQAMHDLLHDSMGDQVIRQIADWILAQDRE